MALFDAFLDGVTGSGLFGKLRWPGAPTEFVDSRTSQEFNAQAEAFFLRDRLNLEEVRKNRAKQARLLETFGGLPKPGLSSLHCSSLESLPGSSLLGVILRRVMLATNVLFHGLTTEEQQRLRKKARRGGS